MIIRDITNQYLHDGNLLETKTGITMGMEKIEAKTAEKQQYSAPLSTFGTQLHDIGNKVPTY